MLAHKGTARLGAVPFIVLFLLSLGQALAEERDYPNRTPPALSVGWQDAAAAGFNMAASCVISGFGAHYHNQGFYEGCAKGIFSGTLIYAGQKMAAYAPYYPGLAYGATVIHSLGVSIRDNVAEDLGSLDRYQFNLGPVQISLGKPSVNDGRRLNAYFLPLPFVGLIYALSVGEFDPGLTLKMGVPIVKADLYLADKLNPGYRIEGMTLAGAIVLGVYGQNRSYR